VNCRAGERKKGVKRNFGSSMREIERLAIGKAQRFTASSAAEFERWSGNAAATRRQ
jgi:hypothetical protein